MRAQRGPIALTALAALAALLPVRVSAADPHCGLDGEPVCPTIQTVSPTLVYSNQATTLTITGSGFDNVTAVRLLPGGKRLSFTEVSTSVVTAVIPAGVAEDSYTLQVDAGPFTSRPAARPIVAVVPPVVARPLPAAPSASAPPASAATSAPAHDTPAPPFLRTETSTPWWVGAGAGLAAGLIGSAVWMLWLQARIRRRRQAIADMEAGLQRLTELQGRAQESPAGTPEPAAVNGRPRQG